MEEQQEPDINKVVSSDKSSFHNHKIIKYIVMGVFILLPFVGFYLGMEYQKQQSVDVQQTMAVSKKQNIVSPTVTLAPSPTIIHDPGYQIIEGSMFNILPNGEEILLFDKRDFAQNPEMYDEEYLERTGGPRPTEYATYFNFSSFELSPDKTKILLRAQGDITPEYLYFGSIDGSAIDYIGYVMDEVAWSSDSRYIAYLSQPADAGGKSMAYIYDTETKEKIDVRKNHNINMEENGYTMLTFSNLRWLDDNSGIQVDYVAHSGEGMPPPYGEVVGSGTTILTRE